VVKTIEGERFRMEMSIECLIVEEVRHWGVI
jgi:hypothetical protein